MQETSPSRAMTWSWFFRRSRKVDLQECWDLEKGYEEPLISTPKAGNTLGSSGKTSTSSFERPPDLLSSLMGWDAPSKGEQ